MDAVGERHNRKLFQMDPNDPNLSPNERKKIEKSIKSKAYRMKQDKLINGMKRQIITLSNTLSDKWEKEKKLKSIIREKDEELKMIRAGLAEKERLVVHALLELLRSRPHSGPPGA